MQKKMKLRDQISDHSCFLHPNQSEPGVDSDNGCVVSPIGDVLIKTTIPGSMAKSVSSCPVYSPLGSQQYC